MTTAIPWDTKSMRMRQNSLNFCTDSSSRPKLQLTILDMRPSVPHGSSAEPEDVIYALRKIRFIQIRPNEDVE